MNEYTQDLQMRGSSGVMRKGLLVVGPILVLGFFVLLLFGVIKLNEKPQQRKKPYTTLAVMAEYAVRDLSLIHI